MVDQVDCLWFLISLLVIFIKFLRKGITNMALCSTNSPHHHPSWKMITESSPSSSASSASSSSMVTTKLPELASKSCKINLMTDEESVSLENEKKKMMIRKRPSKIVIPESFVSLEFGEVEKEKDLGEKEVEVEENEYCLACKKGKRHVMEDGYGVITNIHGDSKQAFFGVFDGHGGRAAVDFVSEKLGQNIVTSLSALLEKEEEEQDSLVLAIKEGYLTTDREFLSKGVSSGACVSTVMFKNGELHVANAGDCRVVMSKNGAANALTSDHRPSRDDERIRIENLGGYVNCRNGVWRVQDSLAVSRAIGDENMKKWVISEPETCKLKLTSECEFLIMASDGLWDKVSNQEAVDIVMKKKNSVRSCKELVELSSKRGGRDDITVMVVDLQKFM